MPCRETEGCVTLVTVENPNANRSPEVEPFEALLTWELVESQL